MYTKTVDELKSIAIIGLRGFYKLKKADLLHNRGPVRRKEAVQFP